MTAAGADLIDIADRARVRAYAPYSKFRVGAVVETASGGVHCGVNVENIAYPTGICAEQAAIAAAVTAEGPALRILRIAIGAENASGTTVPCTPCGGCRQYILEFGADIGVVFRDAAGTIVEARSRELLPHGFSFQAPA
jgi:cytidine deaminase